MAQLVDRSLTTPQIFGSIPYFSKVLFTNCTLEKIKLTKKMLGMAHLFQDLHGRYRSACVCDDSTSEANWLLPALQFF